MKKTRVFVVSLVLLASGASIAAIAQWKPGMRTFGTFYCSNCPVGYPRIDSTTKNEIALVRDSLNRQQATSTTWITPGDVIVICNASACVKYEVTSGGEGYHGISHEPQSPLTGGGGGGGGGDFGSGFGGGGGWGGDWGGGGGGTGSVWVGAPENPR